jgi:hypothetical protein
MAMLHDERFVCTGFLRKRNTQAWKLVRASTTYTWSLGLRVLTIAPNSTDAPL